MTFNHKPIFKTIFGSQLYGTATPESDSDFKGVFVPDVDSLLLQQAPKCLHENTKQGNAGKNTKDDVDFESYSLHYFLEMDCKGETATIDMLHAPMEYWITYDIHWLYLHNSRSMFYTKNMSAFLGYCKTQAAKYGVKGSRMAAAGEAIKFLHSEIFLRGFSAPITKISDVWDKLPEGEHLIKSTTETPNKNQDSRCWEVCNRKIMGDTKLPYALEMMKKFYDSYGERAKMAEENKGIDWKAISHAFRAGLQLKEIYETGDLVFPLRDAEFLMNLKMGVPHYKDDRVGEALEQLIAEVEQLAAASKYPEKVDRTYWDKYLLEVYNVVWR